MKTILAALLTVSALSIWPAIARDKEDIILGMKIFTDSIYGVSITGTLTGDGVDYRNNTVTIVCYQDRMECWISRINQIGPNHMGSLQVQTF